MTIVSAELYAQKSKVVANDATNGGRMSENRIVTNVDENVFPVIFSQQLLDGIDYDRKLFWWVRNDDDLSLQYAFQRLYDILSTEAYAYFWLGTARDTMADYATNTETKYGVGRLKTDIAASATVLTVTVPHADLASGTHAIYAAGTLVAITDKETYLSGTGNVELREIDSIDSVSGMDVTMTLTVALANAYTEAAPTKIQSYPAKATIGTSVDNVVKTGIGTTTFDENAVTLDNIGTREQTITFEMLDATNFTATSDDPDITLAAGVISSDYAPNHPTEAKPYFTIPAGTIAGSPVVGDTFSFQTHAATVAIWEHLEVPAATSAGLTSLTMVNSGESA